MKRFATISSLVHLFLASAALAACTVNTVPVGTIIEPNASQDASPLPDGSIQPTADAGSPREPEAGSPRAPDAGQPTVPEAGSPGWLPDGGNAVHDDGVLADSGPGWIMPQCEAPFGPARDHTSIGAVKEHIAGGWALCSGSIVAPADTAGVEFNGDKAHFLIDAGGVLVRGGTSDYERDVTFLEGPVLNGRVLYQMNLEGRDGTTLHHTRISEDGRFLELQDEPDNPTRFVRAAPKQSAPVCGTPGPAHTYTSVADVVTRISGRWSICSGTFANAPPNAAGVEIVDGMVYYLVRSETGLQRKNLWDYEATMEVSDDTMVAGPGVYYVALSRNGGTGMYLTEATESGDMLRFTVLTDSVVLARVP